MGKKCRSWEKNCITVKRVVQSVCTGKGVNYGKGDTKMPYGLDWDWLLDLIKGKDEKEEE